MGVSTDAILVWGFDLGDELGEAPSEQIERWGDSEWSKQEELEKSSGAELITHCSDQCPMYIVGFTHSKVKAWRGYPKEIDSLALDMGEGQAALDAFAAALGVPTQPGRWLLASYWG